MNNAPLVVSDDDVSKAATQAVASTSLPQLIDVPKVAGSLGISITTAWQLVYSGELPSLKIGRRRLCRAEDVEAFVAAKVEEAAR